VQFDQNPDHAAIRDAVAQIAAPYGGAYYTEHAERHEPTTELWQALGRQGFIGINIPEEFGGGGAGLTELALVCEETAAVGAPLLLLLVSSAISGEVLTRYGSEQQKKTWLPGMAAGQRKVVFAITEPDAGSNTHQLSTTARRDGDEWVLRGTKYYISGVDEADALIVVARTGTDPVSGKGLMSLFLVPTDSPGLAANELPVSASLPEKQFTLFFDDVRLDAGQLVGGQDEGFRQVFHGLNPERITGAAICVGVGRYALARAASYATTRSVWGAPIGTHQGLSHPLAKCKVELELSKLMMQKAASLYDGGDDMGAGEAANMAKYAAAEASIACVDQAVQTHGGNGLAHEYGLGNLLIGARVARIAPVSREMILNFVAQFSLGLPKSY